MHPSVQTLLVMVSRAWFWDMRSIGELHELGNGLVPAPLDRHALSISHLMIIERMSAGPCHHAAPVPGGLQRAT